MATATQTPPEEDQNPLQQHYDDEFNHLTSPEHMAQDGETGSLNGGPNINEGSGFFNPTDAAESHDTTGQSVGNLAQAEQQGNQPGQLFNQSDGGGSNLRQRISNFIGQGMTRRRAIIGGGTVSVVLMLFMGLTTTSALELIHIRENMLGNGNSLVNKALQHRFHKSMARMLRKLATSPGESFSKNLDSQKFQQKFRDAGFTVEYDSEGKLSKFAYGDTNFDLTNPNVNKEFDKFLSGPNAEEIASKIDEAGGLKAQTWVGRYASKLWSKIGANFSDWLDKKPTDDKAKNPTEEFAERLRAAQSAAAQGANPEVQQSAEEEKAVENATHPTGGSAQQQATGLPDGVTGTPSAQEQTDKLDNNPSFNPDAGPGNDTVNSASESIVNDLENNPAAIGTDLPSSLVDAAKNGLNGLAFEQTACGIKGRVNFVAALQNVAVAYQLAKFTLLFLTAADNQKAGVIKSSGMQLLMTYINTRNPRTGKTAVNSGGLRALFGDKSANASVEDISKFSTGRHPSGVLGAIYKWVNKALPTTSSSCKFVNNKIVSFGGLAIGVILAVTTGGGFTVAQGVQLVGLAVMQQVVFTIGTQLLMKSVTGIALHGLEQNGELVGDALGSGFGSLSAMNAGANALRPATRAQALALQNEVNVDNRYALAHESLFDKYLSTANSQSVASTISLQLAPALSTPGNAISSVINGIPHIFSSVFNAVNPFVAKAAAADDPTQHCNSDPLIQQYNLATDQFCNIVMANAPDIDPDLAQQILKSNNQIDDNGEPIPGSEYAKWIGDGSKDSYDCASGRTGLLYSDPNKNPSAFENGEEDIEQVDGSGYNPCFAPGKPFEENQGQPGRYDLFAAWYGYMDDQSNFTQYINDDYGSSTSNAQSTDATTANNSNTNYYQDSSNIQCAAGTTDLGIHDGWYNGQKVNIRLCGLPNLPASYQESTPGNPYYINGANGIAAVNSVASKQFFDMVNAAKAAGLPMSADSAYRTMDHQTVLCQQDARCSSGDYTAVKKPGYSNHQMGLAVDFHMPTRALGTANCVNVNGICTAPGDPVYTWLVANAKTYGLQQYSPEFWHWSVNGQ